MGLFCPLVKHNLEFFTIFFGPLISPPVDGFLGVLGPSVGGFGGFSLLDEHTGLTGAARPLSGPSLIPGKPRPDLRFNQRLNPPVHLLVGRLPVLVEPSAGGEHQPS